MYDEERSRGNRFELDVIVRGDFKTTGVKDDLSLVPDYEIIEETAVEIMAGPSRFLIEKLCHEIGNRMMERMPEIQILELALRKITPPLKNPVAYAEIRMQWQR